MRSSGLRFAIIGGCLAVILLMHAVGFLQPLENVAVRMLLPVQSFGARIGYAWRERFPQITNDADLQTKVRDLEARLSALSIDRVKLASLEEENRTLRDTAKFLSDNGYDHVSARVIGKSTDISRSTILIDRGSNDGIEVGMAVIAGNGIYVGKIGTLHERVSTVVLMADPSSRVAASPLSGNRLYGLIQGEGNGVARLTLVPQSEPLQANDVVVTAGTEEKIPPNLSIALVNDVEGKPTDPFKTATLEPLARADKLQLVAILRPAAFRPEETK